RHIGNPGGLRPLAGQVDHGRIDVNAYDRSLLTDPFGEHKSDLADAGANIQHLHPSGNVGGLQEGTGEAVEKFRLAFQPSGFISGLRKQIVGRRWGILVHLVLSSCTSGTLSLTLGSGALESSMTTLSLGESLPPSRGGRIRRITHFRPWHHSMPSHTM